MSQWNSGIDWQYSIYRPMLFNVDGNVIWFFAAFLYIREWWLFKAFLVFYAVLFVAALFQYQMGDLLVLWNRWRIGKTRPLYCKKMYLTRYLRGF